MHVRLLGPVEVDVQGRTVTIRRRQERGLLAVLALDCRRLVPVERLTDLIWQGSPPADPRAALHAMVSHLRSALDDRDGGRHLVGRGKAYLLDLDPLQVDAHLFRSLHTRARAAGDPQQRAESLGQALRLWHGPALAGLDPRLRARLAPALDDQHVSAELDWLAARLDLDEHAALLEPLTRLVADHPLADRPRELLMLALYRSGRTDEALQVFRDARALLREQLGLDPGPRLREIERQILTGDPSLAVPPSLPPHPGVPAELPAPPAGFTGRAEQLGRLDALVADGGDARHGARVIAVTGGPGVGKTSLAVYWAQQRKDRFPDGQLYLDLRGFTPGPALDPAAALVRALGSLGVGAGRLPSQLDALAATFRTMVAGRRILIVLDNAADAEQVRPLLPAAPGSLVLVTSRNRMSGLISGQGASRLSLDLLTPGEATELLARTVGPHRLDAEPAAAQDLINACARLPLALRIVAAHLLDHPERTLAEQAAYLAHPAGLDGLGVDDDPEGAVRAAFDGSLSRLPEPVRQLFGTMGAAPVHDFTVESAAAAAGTQIGQTRQLLDRLVGAHLVSRGTDGRFGMHDLLRSYAAERLRNQEAQAAAGQALTRLLRHYLAVADRAARVVYPYMVRLELPADDDPDHGGTDGDPRFTGSATATDWLDQERDNMLAVIRAVIRAGTREDAPAAAAPGCWLLVDTLRGYLWHSGPGATWVQAAREALAAAVHGGDRRAQAAMHLSLGTAHHRLLQYDRAIAAFSAALDTSLAAGWSPGAGAALNALGNLHDHLGRTQDAVKHFTQALHHLEQPGDESVQAMVRCNLGRLCLASGDLAAGREQLITAGEIARTPGSRAGLATILAQLAAVEHALGLLEQADQHLQEALELTAVADRTAVLTAHVCAAGVWRDRGDLDRAHRHADAAREVARQIGDPIDDLEVHRLTATLHAPASRSAVEHHRAALRIAEDLNLPSAQAEARLGLALADLHAGDLDRARAGAEQALTAAHGTGAGLLDGRALVLRAATNLTRDPDAAVQDAGEAVVLHRRQGATLHEASALTVLAHACRNTRQPGLAEAHLRRAALLTARAGADHASVCHLPLAHPDNRTDLADARVP